MTLNPQNAGCLLSVLSVGKCAGAPAATSAPRGRTPEDDSSARSNCTLLVAKVDELAMTTRDLNEIRAGDRAASPRVGPVVPQCDHYGVVMVEAIRLRAHARPLDEPGQ
jgi:hypothetical protein